MAEEGNEEVPCEGMRRPYLLQNREKEHLYQCTRDREDTTVEGYESHPHSYPEGHPHRTGSRGDALV